MKVKSRKRWNEKSDINTRRNGPIRANQKTPSRLEGDCLSGGTGGLGPNHEEKTKISYGDRRDILEIE